MLKYNFLLPLLFLFLACEYSESIITQLQTIEKNSKDNTNIPHCGNTNTSSSEVIIQPGPDHAQDCNTHFSLDTNAHSTWENHNNGLNDIFGVGVYDANTTIRALIRFDIPDSITAEKLLSAKLVLHTHKWLKKDVDSILQIDIHKMLRSWKQGNYYGGYYNKGRNSSIIDGVTALERFYGLQDGTEDWSAIGVGMNDIDATKKIYASSSKQCGDSTAWEFDVSELVREWVANENQNFGMLLRSPIDQVLKVTVSIDTIYENYDEFSIPNENYLTTKLVTDTSLVAEYYSYPDIVSGNNKDFPNKRPSLVLLLK